MGYPKKSGYIPEYELCSHNSLAYTHPARILIMKLISAGHHYHQDICKRLPLSKSTVSHHIKYLVERDFVSFVEESPLIRYELNSTVLMKCLDEFNEIIGEILD